MKLLFTHPENVILENNWNY